MELLARLELGEKFTHDGIVIRLCSSATSTSRGVDLVRHLIKFNNIIILDRVLL